MSGIWEPYILNPKPQFLILSRGYQPRPGTLPKKIEYFEMCFQVLQCAKSGDL